VTPFAWGLLAAAAGAALVLATRQGTPGAALLGFAVSFAMVLGFGPGVMAPVALFVLGSGLLTRAGRARKERLQAAERDRGRRSAPHVLAKLGIPALLGVAAALAPDAALVLGGGAAAALAAAFADTAATETGPLAGGPVFRLSGGRIARAEHGTPGGVSVAGLAAGAAAALALGALAGWVRLGPAAGAPFAAAGAGFSASLVESAAAGSALGRRVGAIGRNLFLSALAAAAGGALAAALLRPGG
jgi:uncharacterized protein (TIGR00297 family)